MGIFLDMYDKMDFHVNFRQKGKYSVHVHNIYITALHIQSRSCKGFRG